jgi:transposase
MINADKRQAVFLLHEEGMGRNQIARQLRISPNTVEVIIQQKGQVPVHTRQDKIQVDPDLLKRLYQECDGYAQRVHEKLVEDEGIRIQYSTLTRLLRELGLRRNREPRCERVPDEPGAEMQHDTTRYSIRLGGAPATLVASLLYLRYSKRRYLRFYRTFNRFRMKCFLHEALMFWQHAAPVCIIDNTNLARLRGTGRNAVIVPEMEAFAQQYGFRFVCHEINHANRKAGEERSFWTVETNFLPGRHFQSLEELNQQAFQWATVRMEHRPVAKSRLIPAKAFDHECHYLVKLPAHLPAPYLVHERDTDQYGFAAFDGNYYWVPGTSREEVNVFEYGDRLKIYQHNQCVAEYALPADGIRNHVFSPEAMPRPARQPNNRKQPAQEEEKRLRAMSATVDGYLNFALHAGVQPQRFLRELFALSCRVTAAVFIETIERALRYRISDIETLRRIARLSISQQEFQFPGVEVDESFRQREAYQQGHLTDAPDLDLYDQMLDDDQEGNHG